MFGRADIDDWCNASTGIWHGGNVHVACSQIAIEGHRLEGIPVGIDVQAVGRYECVVTRVDGR